MRPILILLALAVSLHAEKPVPLIAKEDFSKGSDAWETTDDKKWKITEVDGNQVFELLGKSNYNPPHRSPHSIALLKDKIVGSFILTARIQTTQTTRGHRDLCFFFNYQDPTHFYYLHLGEVPDPNSSQIFIVNEAPRKNLTLSKKGIPWKNGQFHNLTIVREVERGGSWTWHGPGQVICYPIIEWQREEEAHVGKIISLIEGWIISALGELGITGRRDARMRGVWVGENKIASIGLSFFHWTSRHGFTINYATPTGRLEEISGCGLESQVTTSLDKLGHRVTKQEIHDALIATVSSIGREIGEINDVEDIGVFPY